MSKIKVNSIEASTGSTITIPSGQTLDISATTLTLPSTVVTTTGTQTLTNKTIGVSQLSGTLPVANGGTGLTTLGSATQVLRVNSGATALEFATPAVASSDFVLLATVTGTDTASLSIDGYFSSTYRGYYVKFEVYPVTDNTSPYFRFRRSNADVTTSNYRGAYNDLRSDGANDPSSDVSTAYARLKANTMDNGGIEPLMGNGWLPDMLNTTYYKTFIGFTNSTSNDNGQSHFTTFGLTLRDATTALSGFTIYMSSGNINGTVTLYGLK
jgi:hypothetical protein